MSSSRSPHEEEADDAAHANAAAAAAAFQSALAQQVRPMLDWPQIMASLHRNMLHQQQPPPPPPPAAPSLDSQRAAAAAMAAAAASAGLPQGGLQGLPNLGWPYGLASAPQASLTTRSQPTPSNTANNPSPLAATGLNPGYLSNMQNLHTPEALLSFQQNLLLLEQIQQQHQLLANNPHLLMTAAAAAQSSHTSTSVASHNGPQTSSSSPHMSHSNNSLPATNHHDSSNNLHHQHQAALAAAANQQLLSNLLAGNLQLQHLQQHHNQQRNGTSSPPNQYGNLNGLTNSHLANNGHSNLLTTVTSAASSLAPSLTNQHQDSLVDQHFRRSLGEDYNQIMSNKTDKINVGK